MDTLVNDMRASHDELAQRLARAETVRPDARHPRERYPATDTFLASASRHQAAMLSVLVPAARRHLENGPDRAHEYVQQARRLEVALAQVKAKLYGSTYAVRVPWPEVWDEVDEAFERTWRLEEALVADLVDAHDDDRLGERIHDAERRSPTRPHPYVPHQGLPGRVARSVARRVDMFWDTAEGRMIPEPVHHHDRSHDGRLAQYLLADPHLDRLEEDDSASDGRHGRR